MRTIFIFLLSVFLSTCSQISYGKRSTDSFNINDFDRTISIVFTDDGVNVARDINKTVTIDCNHVTVDNKSEEMVIYRFSGKAMDASVSGGSQVSLSSYTGGSGGGFGPGGW
jgi:hypothetical protein